MGVCNYVISMEGENWFKNFENINKKELAGLANYIGLEDSLSNLSNCVKFVEKMFLDHGYSIYASSEPLFTKFLEKFPEISEQSLLSSLV